MSVIHASEMIELLERFALLTPGRQAELPHLVPDGRLDARVLARALVQKDWLTLFQANQLLAGQGEELVVGPYHVVERLGQGGLSTVYKAVHRKTKQIVAVKVIKPEVFTNEEGRDQFLQEVEAMARLDHANIVQFCDVDESGSTFYFAMEFVEGLDLGKQVRLNGPLSVRDACNYIHQTALGLQHAHERNLVHRDIKPVNLFLTHGRPNAKTKNERSQVVKILDWGLASVRAPRGVHTQERVVKSILGTADYLSPEQARNANSVDIRGDIYSLGCTFYFLLTGQPPFPDGTLMQKLINHQKNDAPPLETFREDVPNGVAAIIKRMMAKDPAQRFQTPAAVAMALLPFIRTGASTVLLARPKLPPTPRVNEETPLPAALANAQVPVFEKPHTKAFVAE